MNNSEVIYSGKRLNPEESTVSDVSIVRVEVSLDKPASMRWLNHSLLHSPTGMNWGYGGSGPADLALSLLIDAFGETLTTEELKRGGKTCARCFGEPGEYEWSNYDEHCSICHGEGKIESRAFRLHHDFKFAFVAGWKDEWRITRDEIMLWADAQDATRAATTAAAFERGTE